MSEVETLGLPSPGEDPTTNGQADHDPGRYSNGRSRQRNVRSAEECLNVLDHLAGMVAMGLITPARANAIRALMHEILAYHQRSASGPSTATPLDRDMLERLRRDPQLMNMMAPLLTPEQIAELMGSTTDVPHP
jgi:hypothetical protein